MGIAKKIEASITQASWIRKMFEEGILLKKQYGADNVFDFSLGNPQMEPPGQVKEHLLAIINDSTAGLHAYMPNAGYQGTRAAVADYLSLTHDVNLTADHVIMTCGAGGALNVILKTLLDPGDEVLIPIPYFVEYSFYVDNAGGKAVLVKTTEDFALDLAHIAASITARTKVILINSPNNPTGKVYSEAELKALANILKDKEKTAGQEIYLVSDEPYRDLAFDGVMIPSVLKLYKNALVVSSYSKNLSLPGERIGYLAINPEISRPEITLAGLTLSNRILGFVNAPALMQRLVAGLQGITVDVGEYKRKRDLLCEGLAGIGYQFTKPQGAFYLFPKTPISDDVEFVKILREKKILAVPGSGFGGPGHFRLAYCVKDTTIMSAMEGFAAAFNECK